MKKELRVVALVLATILVFLVGVGIGVSKGIEIEVNVQGSASAGSVQTVAPTQAPVTQAPVTQAPTQAPATTAPAAQDTTAAPAPQDTTAAPAPQDTTAAPADTTAAPSASSVPSTPAEVVKAYNDAVNAAKKAPNITIHKVGTIDLKCTDCSVGFLKPVVNTALPAIAKPTEWTRTFVNGKQTDGDEELKWALSPSGDKECLLTEADVASATATPNGDGYDIKLVIKAETSTFDGTNTTTPDAHNKAMTPLNLATLELPIEGAAITSANMSYPGATCEASVDGQGRLTKLHIVLPMSGTGAGGIKGVNVEVGIEGTMDDLFEITY